MSGDDYVRVTLKREVYEDIVFLKSLMGAKGISDMVDFLIGYYTLESERRGKSNKKYLDIHREEIQAARK